MNEKRPPTVLILHGDRFQSSLIQHYLEEAGYRVFATSQNENTAAVIARVMPQLVLLDWNLPEMRALAVTRLIRGDRRFAWLPIILVGRDIGCDNKILSLEVGVDLCLEGIIYPKELAARVRSLLRRSTQPDSRAGRTGRQQ